VLALVLVLVLVLVLAAPEPAVAPPAPVACNPSSETRLHVEAPSARATARPRLTWVTVVTTAS
jgi:hypothetical protein